MLYLDKKQLLGLLYPFFIVYAMFFYIMPLQIFNFIIIISVTFTLISAHLKSNILFFYINEMGNNAHNITTIFDYLSLVFVIGLSFLCIANILFRTILNFSRLVGNTFIFENQQLLFCLEEKALLLFPRIPDPIKEIFNKVIIESGNTKKYIPSNKSWGTGASIAIIGGSLIGLATYSEVRLSRLQTTKANDFNDMKAGFISEQEYKDKWFKNRK